jgi:hypothetical protein
MGNVKPLPMGPAELVSSTVAAAVTRPASRLAAADPGLTRPVD